MNEQNDKLFMIWLKIYNIEGLFGEERIEKKI
jgi:hypothetical protein